MACACVCAAGRCGCIFFVLLAFFTGSFYGLQQFEEGVALSPLCEFQ